MSKNSSTASIELWLVSNSSYRQDRIKKTKKSTFLKILTGKNFKIVCRNEVLLVFKNAQNLFFTPKFLLSFFRMMSLVSHHAAFLEKMFYKKNSALFLFSVVNYSRLCSFILMHTHFHQFCRTWNHLTMSKNNSTASIELWLVSNSSYRQDRIKEKKNGIFFKILTGKNFKIVCRKKVLLVFKNVQNLFFTPKFLLSFFRLMSVVSHHAAFLDCFERRILPFF